ncbi:MAG: prepilin peptidase [Planctomycetota bacterium]
MPYQEAILNFLTAAWLGSVGACIGSFLNVVAYRVPRGESVVRGGSACPQCGHAIRAKHNVPVVSWLILRGKCRDCSAPIPARYVLVEVAVGLMFFMLAYAELFSGGANLPGRPINFFPGAALNVWYPRWPLIGAYLYHCTLLALLVTIALMDSDRVRTPKPFLAAGVAVGVASQLTWWPKLFFAWSEKDIPYAPLLYGGGVILSMVFGLLLSLTPPYQRAKKLRGSYPATVFSPILIGAYLGYVAAVQIFIVSLPIALALWLATRRSVSFTTAAAYAIPTATLLFLCFWKQLAPFL